MLNFYSDVYVIHFLSSILRNWGCTNNLNKNSLFLNLVAYPKWIFKYIKFVFFVHFLLTIDVYPFLGHGFTLSPPLCSAWLLKKPFIFLCDIPMWLVGARMTILINWNFLTLNLNDEIKFTLQNNIKIRWHWRWGGGSLKSTRRTSRIANSPYRILQKI